MAAVLKVLLIVLDFGYYMSTMVENFGCEVQQGQLEMLNSE